MTRVLPFVLPHSTRWSRLLAGLAAVKARVVSRCKGWVERNVIRDGPQDQSPIHLRDKYPDDPELRNPW